MTITQQISAGIMENGEDIALGGYATEAEAAQAAHDAYRSWNLRCNLNDIYELKLQLGLIDPADRTDDYLDEEL